MRASLTATQANALIAGGVVNGGMIPKVQTALEALERGVPRVRIVNLAGLKGSGGTVFLNEQAAASVNQYTASAA